MVYLDLFHTDWILLLLVLLDSDFWNGTLLRDLTTREPRFDSYNGIYECPPVKDGQVHSVVKGKIRFTELGTAKKGTHPRNHREIMGHLGRRKLGEACAWSLYQGLRKAGPVHKWSAFHLLRSLWTLLLIRMWIILVLAHVHSRLSSFIKIKLFLGVQMQYHQLFFSNLL